MKTFNYYNPLSKSGRRLSPPPSPTIKTQKEWDGWLLKEAKQEASNYESILLKQIDHTLQLPKKSKKRNSLSLLTKADYDTIHLILFGDIDIQISYEK